MMVSDEYRLIYFDILRSGSGTLDLIMTRLGAKGVAFRPDQEDPLMNLSEEQKKYFKFTFVRNPVDRFVST